MKGRSLLRRSPKKHAVENLFTVCAGTAKSCHQQLTDKKLLLYPTTDKGTNGPVRVEKYNKKTGEYVLAMRAA